MVRINAELVKDDPQRVADGRRPFDGGSSAPRAQAGPAGIDCSTSDGTGHTYHFGMARRREPMPKPRDAVVNGAWPTGRIDQPVAAWYAARIAIAVLGALEEQELNLNEASRRCGIDRETLVRVIDGETYPDLVTVSALEVGLGARLWPDGPVRVLPRE